LNKSYILGTLNNFLLRHDVTAQLIPIGPARTSFKMRLYSLSADKGQTWAWEVLLIIAIYVPKMLFPVLVTRRYQFSFDFMHVSFI
jgi:hypothetical protein